MAYAVRLFLKMVHETGQIGRVATKPTQAKEDAVNAGIFRGAQLEAEARGDVAPFKQWLATEDNRTRPTHRAADKQRTLLSEPFTVGGARLLFPGDPRGPAGEVINCRCTMLPVVLGETIDWTSRQGVGR